MKIILEPSATHDESGSYMKVKKGENPYSRMVKLSSATTPVFIKHRAMKCECSMGFSDMTDRIV